MAQADGCKHGMVNSGVGLITGIAMDNGALIVSLERRAVEHAFGE